MKTHTPGPWIVVDDEIIDADDNTIAHINAFTQWNTTSGMATEKLPWKANAELIALSPDLADALRELYEAGLTMDSIPYYKALKKAKTLIDKLPVK